MPGVQLPLGEVRDCAVRVRTRRQPGPKTCETPNDSLRWMKSAPLGFAALGFPLVGKVRIESIFAAFPLFLLAAFFAFLALFAAVAHDVVLPD